MDNNFNQTGITSLEDIFKFSLIQVFPRLFVIFVISQICEEIFKNEYYFWISTAICLLLQYKFSFLVYTLYVTHKKDNGQTDNYSILSELADVSWNKSFGVFKKKNSIVIKSIISEDKVYMLADKFMKERGQENYRTLLHPNMKFEHKKFRDDISETVRNRAYS